MIRLAGVLIVASLFAGTAGAQAGGTPQGKCIHTAATATGPTDWDSTESEDCGDFGIMLPGIGYIGLPGQICPTFIYHLGAHADCGAAGGSPETNCVEDSELYVQSKECRCSTITIGIFTFQGFACDCDDEWQPDGVAHKSMKTVPC